MDTAPPRPYRRRHWLVNRPLQLAFVRAMLVVLGVMVGGALAAVYLAIRMTLSAYELSQDVLAVSLLTTVFWVMLLELLVLVPAIAWIGILLTHKVAGPLVRIRAALAKMTQGERDIHITLRKGDALVDLAEDINRLAETLRRHP